MKALKVRYIRQKQYHCGAAVLEMIYKYYGLNNVNQDEIFQSRSVIDSGTQLPIIYVTAMQEDALERNFSVFSGSFTFNSHRDYMDTLKVPLNLKLPIIVCHRWIPDESFGHFSIVVDLNESSVIVHDPDRGAKIHIPHKEFRRLCSSNGKSVADNFMIIIAPTGTVLPEPFVFEYRNI